MALRVHEVGREVGALGSGASFLGLMLSKDIVSDACGPLILKPNLEYMAKVRTIKCKDSLFVHKTLGSLFKNNELAKSVTETNASTTGPGVRKLLIRNATFKKIWKSRAALIGRVKKRSTCPQVSYFSLKLGDEQKRSSV